MTELWKKFKVDVEVIPNCVMRKTYDRLYVNESPQKDDIRHRRYQNKLALSKPVLCIYCALLAKDKGEELCLSSQKDLKVVRPPHGFVNTHLEILFCRLTALTVAKRWRFFF